MLAFCCFTLFVRGYLRFNHPGLRQYPVQGVDVSHHQGAIDWRALKGPTVRFAFIKASEGKSYRDPAFLQNWAGASAAGITPGAYHFYSLCVPAADQAANFLHAAPPQRYSLPPAVDLELGGNCGGRPSSPQFAQELRIFLEAVEKAWGCQAVLYVTQEFYQSYAAALSSHPLWVRDVFTKPRLRGGDGWRLWQFANRGRLPGVEGFVDLDVFSGTAEGFAAFRCGAKDSRRSGLRPLPPSL